MTKKAARAGAQPDDTDRIGRSGVNMPDASTINGDPGGDPGAASDLATASGASDASERPSRRGATRASARERGVSGRRLPARVTVTPPSNEVAPDTARPTTSHSSEPSRRGARGENFRLGGDQRRIPGAAPHTRRAPNVPGMPGSANARTTPRGPQQYQYQQPPHLSRLSRPQRPEIISNEHDEPPTLTPAREATIAAFVAAQPYPLDLFQMEAIRHLAGGRSVLVAAPTGTGKTVVAEYAIWQTREAGLRAIYTAPIKALSNQKFRDLRALYGADAVGLLTGDIVENAAAPIVVMTTEIYRNMLLEGSRVARQLGTAPHDEADEMLRGVAQRNGAPDPADTLPEAADIVELARRARLDEELSSVGCVIFDELHFLNDPERGPVWEEAIIHSPPHVTFVGLSATVSNADELRRWIEEVHGPMALVYHDERAVPIEHYYFLDNVLHLAQDPIGQRIAHFPGIGGEAKIARMRQRARRYSYYDPEDEGGELSGSRTGSAQREEEQEQPQERPTPQPSEVLTALRKADLLPCIYFLPGRRAVEQAAQGTVGHLLVTPEQRIRLNDEVQQWVQKLPVEDRRLEQVQTLTALLPRGIGYHHAGLLPGLKVMVETLFARGELRAVFATDTLALGVNMPARSVVLGSLSKFDGVQMRLMTPNEYQQLTGRAGRRGMDEQGAAVIPYSPWDAFEPAFAALTAPLLPVTSAFTVRYNTVLNLWRSGDVARLQRAVAASLREYQRRRLWSRAATRRSNQRDGAMRAYYEPRSGRTRRRREGEQEQPFGLSEGAAAELNATIYVLRALGYIGEDDELTLRGRLLRAIFHPAGIVLTELILNGALDDLSPAELAEVMSWFTFDNDKALRNLFSLPPALLQARRAVYRALRFVQDFEDNEGLAVSPGIIDSFHSVALHWARGMTLSGLLRRIDLAEGDLLVTLNQTIDLLQQTQSAIGQTLDARDLWIDMRSDDEPDDERQSKKRKRRAPSLAQTHERLAALRPRLGDAWRSMLRGSVAMSRAVPSMATGPTETPPDTEAVANDDGQPAVESLPPLPMAEDLDPDESARDREEAPPDGTPDGTTDAANAENGK
ncbi:MAG: DEAD/DEAH box helicase [Ktedonobacterales bacterium]